MRREKTRVGLDVHARKIVGGGIDGETGEVFRRTMSADHVEVLSWVKGLPGLVEVVYEAGPTGYGLARFLDNQGVPCVVAAPSKLLKAAGDRVKTDPRDAMVLARLMRLDEIVAITIPSVDQEADRDLIRAREACRAELMRARHRLSKFLLRNSIVFPQGKTAWIPMHDRWLRQQGKLFTNPAQRLTFDSSYEAVLMVTARRDQLDTAIDAIAADSEYTPVVTRLGCLRGVSTLTGLGLAVEVGDWTRFTGGNISSYFGLVPSEHSSGESRRLGAITKTGNTHARRLLVESAWHHRKPYRSPGPTMRDRWKTATPAAKTRGHKGNRRLHDRWVSFDARHKRATVANVAIARELAGWCWSLATLEE